MNLQKLNPWNWFSHEDRAANDSHHIPIKRDQANLHRAEDVSNMHPIVQLQQEMDRLFDDTLKGFGFPSLRHNPFGQHFWPDKSWVAKGEFHPTLNVASDDKHYWITLEAAGLKESDLSLEINGDILIIRGEKKEEVENKDRHFYRIECRYGSFQRTLSLPDDSIPDDIHADMKDGVLKVSIPRKEMPGEPVRKIKINS